MSESNEIVVVDNTTPTQIQPLQTVDVDAAKDFMDNYQELVEALLDKSDYQPIKTKDGIKHSKKKSAWRKLATAFNISDEVAEKEIIRDEHYRIISARYEVIATLPNGRHGVGTGSASIFDKISKKDDKEPTPFELRQRFTNAEHDVISTAHTRAKSRAISDLIGAGEVSAEELSDMSVKPGKPVKPKPTTHKPQSKPKAPNSSNIGNKPKAPKAPVKPKADDLKPKLDDEAIEAEVVEVKEDKPKSFKEICDSNPALTLAVQELKANGSNINQAYVHDKLLDLWDIGKITDEELEEAKALLE